MTEAERLAQGLDKEQIDTVRRDMLNHEAAALLRSQAAEIERLREALNAVFLECDWYSDNGRDAMEKAGKLLRGEA